MDEGWSPYRTGHEPERRLGLWQRLLNVTALHARQRCPPRQMPLSVYVAVGKLFRGIGMKAKSGRDNYFRTHAGPDVLAAAHPAGF